jgi:hypothetical protein
MRSVGQAVRIEHVFPGQPAQDLVHAGLILERQVAALEMDDLLGGELGQTDVLKSGRSAWIMAEICGPQVALREACSALSGSYCLPSL